MSEMSPGMAARRLHAGVTAGARKVLSFASTRIGARATSAMRSAKGEPKRRSREDRGPLRIVTGTHARAVRGGPHAFSAGAIERISVGPLRATLEKGVDTDLDPGGYNETGAIVKNGFGRGIRIEIPARPTIVPAGKMEKGTIKRKAAAIFAEGIRASLRGR
jgi:hypothetical protein